MNFVPRDCAYVKYNVLRFEQPSRKGLMRMTGQNWSIVSSQPTNAKDNIS